MKEQMKLTLKKLTNKQAIKIKGQQGITLIALIVTIIILLILAGVTINIALGQNGLFTKSKEAVEKHKEEAAREKISMTLGEYMFDINASDMPKEEQESHLLELLGNLGLTTDGGDHYEVAVDGYVFWVDKETEEIISKGPEKTVELTGIKVKDTSKNVTINVGQTKLIEIEVEPEGASTRDIEYTSSNNNIVEVKNGTIKGIAEGTAEVTISSSKNASIKETINVTVKEVEKEIEKISLKPTTLTLGVGETTEQGIQVEYIPNNAVNQGVTWSSSDETKATVDSNGKVKGIAKTEENNQVIVTATTANGKTATCKVTVEIRLPDAGTTVPTEGWNIEVAKGLVKRDGLQAHIGELVNYHPTTDSQGKYRIFYYDETGYFEKEGSSVRGRLYLKRECETLTVDLSNAGEYTGSEPAVSIMRAMNPMWRNSNKSDSIDQMNERLTASLCDPNNWDKYCDTKVAEYAIGGPSVELYMRAYNIYKKGREFDTTNITVTSGDGLSQNVPLCCKIGTESDDFGYNVGDNGSYTYGGSTKHATSTSSVDGGCRNLFIYGAGTYTFLSSPSSQAENNMCGAWGDSARIYPNIPSTQYCMPLVALKI